MHYPLGHDNVVSAFEVTVKEASDTQASFYVDGEVVKRTGKPAEVAKKPLIKVLSDPEADPSFNFFFGGVGDARNAFCTLGSLWRQLDGFLASGKLSKEQVQRIKVSMTVNDVDPTILCRLWVNTSLLFDYGAALANGDMASIEQARSNVFDAFLLTLLRDDADASIRDVIGRGFPSVDLAAPWGGQIMNQNTAKQMTAVYDRWKKDEVTPHQMYTYCMPPCIDLLKSVAESLKLPTDGSPKEISSAILKKALSLPRDALAKIVVDLGIWEAGRPIASREDIYRIRTRFGGFCAHFNKDDVSANLLDIEPKPLEEALERYSKFHIFYDMPGLKQIRKDSVTDQIAYFKDNLLPSLHPNLTFCHRDLPNHHVGVVRRPSDVLGELCGGLKKLQTTLDMRVRDVMDSMVKQFKSPNTKQIEDEIKSQMVPKHKTIEEAMDEFFGDAARAIYFLAEFGGLDITFAAGDMHDVAGQITKTVPVFDHIYLSNVPDYSGLLVAFAKFIPLIKPGGYLQHSILFRSSLYANITEYLFSTTRLPTLEWAHKMLGIRYVTGSLEEDTPILWQRDIPPIGRGPRVSQQDLMYWLHELLFRIISPAEVDGQDQQSNGLCESSPNTVDAFFAMLLCLGSAEFQIPMEWIAGACVGIVSGPLVSLARRPQQTPGLLASSVLIDRTKHGLLVFEMAEYMVDIALGFEVMMSGRRTAHVVEVVYPPEYCGLIARKIPCIGIGTNCQLGCAVFLHPSVDVIKLTQLGRNHKSDPLYSRASLIQLTLQIRAYGGQAHMFSAFEWDITTGIVRLEFPEEMFREAQSKSWKGAIMLYSMEWRQSNDLHEPLSISFPLYKEGVTAIRMQAKPPRHCAVCNADDAKHRCGGCGFQRYCSRRCQKSDWTKRNHKSWCTSVMKADEEAESAI